MPTNVRPRRPVDADEALRTILEGTTRETGERFFEALVENVAKALDARGAWVTEYLPERGRLRALAFWLDGKLVPDYEYDVSGTPCEPVIETASLVHFPENVIRLFPKDPDLKAQEAVSYMGAPLQDTEGVVLGHLAVLDDRPMPEERRMLSVFRIFAARAAAELTRLRAEAEAREREKKLAQLLGSTMDAVIEVNAKSRVTMMNAAAEKALNWRPEEAMGRDLRGFLSNESGKKLEELIRRIDDLPEGKRSLWVPHGLEVQPSGGDGFFAEATLTRYELREQPFYTLILRNVNDRLEAERKIRSLSREAAYLREEIRALEGAGELLGESEALARVLRDIREVAETDATVLIRGETGTGKELVARAIHAASRRSARPLIKVNCGALPANLIESELFGHEKGAFTGATQKREGRFVLADSGSLFLDEVGELPLELQVKLLRVLQEGELEPVGSSRTRKVDVRVIAATNRDLRQAVREGSFREDLFYRLDVFPIEVPPLRERREDIGILAAAFAKRFAERARRKIEPLSAECIRRLESYAWPGNVRELQNVIERAVITSRDGRLNLERALPEAAGAIPARPVAGPYEARDRILTAAEMEAFEKENMLRALESANWRVSGRGGAAERLGMRPSTLSSRMKALGIERPRR